jgi:hypothetical protein
MSSITYGARVIKSSGSEPTSKPVDGEISQAALDDGLSRLGNSIVNFHAAFLRTCRGAGARSGCGHDEVVAQRLTSELLEGKWVLPDGTKVTWDRSLNVEGHLKIVSGETELRYRHLGTENGAFLYINGKQNFIHINDRNDPHSVKIGKLADKSANEYGSSNALKSSSIVLQKVGRWIEQRADAEQNAEIVGAFNRSFAEMRMPKP